MEPQGGGWKIYHTLRKGGVWEEEETRKSESTCRPRPPSGGRERRAREPSNPPVGGGVGREGAADPGKCNRRARHCQPSAEADSKETQPISPPDREEKREEGTMEYRDTRDCSPPDREEKREDGTIEYRGARGWSQ